MNDPGSGRDETEVQRADRNLAELLTELRVALPGVQVLFAFLLVVPFNQRFAEVTSFERNVYFVTLCFTAAASVFLIAPSMHHRILFRKRDKEHIVVLANKLSIAGLGFLAVAMTGVILLVTDFLFSSRAAVPATAGMVVLFLLVWFLPPLRRLDR